MDKVIDESFLKSDVTEFALGYDRVNSAKISFLLSLVGAHLLCLLLL